jgi:hypothetical protein
MCVVPYLVPGSASSGMVIFWVPYWNWHLGEWSHFRYRALPVPVWSFLGSRTRTGIYVRGAISGAFLILDGACGVSLSQILDGASLSDFRERVTSVSLSVRD